MGYKNEIILRLLILIIIFAPWFTHIIVCIKNEKWILLISGAIMVPIAWIHGIGIWVGIF